MLELFTGAIIGGAASCFLAKRFYKRSGISMPEWITHRFHKFPACKATSRKLPVFSSDNKQHEQAAPHPVFPVTCCPVCGKQHKELKVSVNVSEYDYMSIMVIECPACGWTENTLV